MPIDAFGRRGRFGFTAPALQQPDYPMTAPAMQSRPMDRGTTANDQPNVNTPGGYATSLRQAGMSRQGALRQALQRDRAVQGHMNVYTPQQRADIYSAPMTGDAQFTPRRAGMEAVNRGINAGAAFQEQMTAPLVQGQMYQNQYQGITNQYAPGMFQSEIDGRNARTQGMQGEERRAQGAFDFTAPYLGPTAAAGVEKTQAQTKQIGAETNAIDRDFRGEIERYKADADRANQTVRQQEVMMRSILSELRSLRQAAGRDTSDIDGLISGDQSGGQRATLESRPEDASPAGRQNLPYNPNQPATNNVDPNAAKLGGNGQQPKQLDANLAKQFLQQAGGDKNRARELARQAGYSF